jgi:hypothetical protein
MTLLLYQDQCPSTRETEIPKARRKGATYDEEHHRLGPFENETQL